ncbi:unnamed protein product [Polarella glacialis]|uniref:Uncharacterized protein n=1 Tax=Polarella glacialis TaxID=89957 RepID=A0A813J2R4_POLGL|nr:unnamed protein product [Polarella glacialis]
MEGLVTYCIEYLLDGNLNHKNCFGLLRMASELGNYGRSAVWKPLHQGCLVYIRDHMALLGQALLKEEGGQALLSLDRASAYALHELFAGECDCLSCHALAADRNLLLSALARQFNVTQVPKKMAPMKKCPKCVEDVGNFLKTCHCGHQFVKGLVKKKGKTPTKKCPECPAELNIGVKSCTCGHVFVKK